MQWWKVEALETRSILLLLLLLLLLLKKNWFKWRLTIKTVTGALYKVFRPNIQYQLLCTEQCNVGMSKVSRRTVHTGTSLVVDGMSAKTLQLSVQFWRFQDKTKRVLWLAELTTYRKYGNKLLWCRWSVEVGSAYVHCRKPIYSDFAASPRAEIRSNICNSWFTGHFGVENPVASKQHVQFSTAPLNSRIVGIVPWYKHHCVYAWTPASLLVD